MISSSSLRSDTELEDEFEAGGTSCLVALSASLLNESCDSDAEDELLSGLVDNPGTTRGTKLFVLQMIVFPSLVNRGFWPPDPLMRTAGALSGNCTVTNRLRSWTNTCASSWGCTFPFAVNTTVGGGSGPFYCVRLSELNSFCSSCALMLLNQLRIRTPLVSLK